MIRWLDDGDGDAGGDGDGGDGDAGGDGDGDAGGDGDCHTGGRRTWQADFGVVVVLVSLRYAVQTRPPKVDNALTWGCPCPNCVAAKHENCCVFHEVCHDKSWTIFKTIISLSKNLN